MPSMPSNVNTRPLAERLAAYGCTDIIRLDEPLSSSAQIEYLDLLPRRNVSARVTAVVEHQGTALLYLVDSCGDVQADSATLVRLQQQLANRSDPAWLGVVRPGSLEIHPIGFHETGSTAPIETIMERDERAPLFFQSLVHGTFTENRRLKGSDYVFKEIFGLLTQTTNAFVPEKGKGKLEALDVLSMAGRALFFRFLIDREIVLPEERTDMPARIFGRTSGKGYEAWRAILRSISITGIISGADLRWSSVWKDVKVPFCLLFARNSHPPRNHRFFYSSPLNEPQVNSHGRFRLDYEATQPISIERLEKQPWLLKTLSLGTWLEPTTPIVPGR